MLISFLRLYIQFLKFFMRNNFFISFFCRLRGGVHCFFSVAGPDRVNRPHVSLSPCRFDSAKIRPVTTRFQIIRQFHLAPRPLSRHSFPRPVPFPQSHSAPYPPLCKYRETFLSLFCFPPSSQSLQVPKKTLACLHYKACKCPNLSPQGCAKILLRLISAAPQISRASIFYSHLRRQK